MKILNLVYLEKSDVKYKISKFPDGQQQITILNPLDEVGYSMVKIISRINNFSDLELIICAVKSLENLEFDHIELYVPYFLGSRSDRQFEEGSNNYLKQVICPIINSLNLKKVIVLDPHSDVLEACLNNFMKFDNKDLISWVFNQKDVEFKKSGNVDNSVKNTILISPDAGASKKIYKIQEYLLSKHNLKLDVITCSKDRDIDGKLTKTTVPLNNLSDKKDFIIIDDICDGGATFINIAKAIRQQTDYGKIYLIVTHGIFSKGFGELEQYFDKIYCTNSYSDLQAVSFENPRKINVEKLVKQLNVLE